MESFFGTLKGEFYLNRFKLEHQSRYTRLYRQLRSTAHQAETKRPEFGAYRTQALEPSSLTVHIPDRFIEGVFVAYDP